MCMITWHDTACGLANGNGTGSSTCCQFNNPPWFCKQLPEPTTEDIEIRQMSNVVKGFSLEDEDTPVEFIEVYVQLINSILKIITKVLLTYGMFYSV